MKMLQERLFQFIKLFMFQYFDEPFERTILDNEYGSWHNLIG